MRTNPIWGGFQFWLKFGRLLPRTKCFDCALLFFWLFIWFCKFVWPNFVAERRFSFPLRCLKKIGCSAPRPDTPGASPSRAIVRMPSSPWRLTGPVANLHVEWLGWRSGRSRSWTRRSLRSAVQDCLSIEAHCESRFQRRRAPRALDAASRGRDGPFGRSSVRGA